MQPLINYTAFPASLFDTTDQNDEGFTIVATRVSYDLVLQQDGQAQLKFSSEQSPLCKSDEHYGDPIRTSVKSESDLAPYKPRTDVIIHATACAPGDKPTTLFGVAVQVGEHTKMLHIHGPRVWRKGLTGWSIDTAKPITSLELRYEYASGGFYEEEGELLASPTNPVGMGWYPTEYLCRCKTSTLPAPQIESATQAISSISEIIRPEGYGFIGRGWRGRIEYSGTADETWRKERHPLLPTDFRLDYWCGAHPELQLPHPAPLTAIPVTLQNLVTSREVPNQSVLFDIPVESIFIFATTDTGIGVTKDLLLDTILIDIPLRKVFCTYRVALSKELNPVETQLRYIAADDRQAQSEKAVRMNKDPTTREFIPLPPSLMSEPTGGKRRG